MSLARRQRDKPSNHEIQPNDCFDPAFEGEQGVGPAFDQRRLSLLTPKMGRTRLSASILGAILHHARFSGRRNSKSQPSSACRICSAYNRS